MRGSDGVLIVSASTGSGHARAAEALRESLAHVEPGLTVEHVDLLALAPRWVRTAYGSGYEFLASRAPWVWREVYRWTDAPTEDSARWGALAHRLIFREFHRLLTSRPWSVCLCTHFLPCQLAAGRPGLPPFALVVTDFTLHRYWVQPRVGRYFVATPSLVDEQRLPRAASEATGIPVAAGFAQQRSRSAARVGLGLHPERPLALVMGGGFGLGVVESALAAARAPVRDLQVLAVCGRSESAAAALRSAGVSPERLRVAGYVDNVAALMAAADVVVTKPGGLTSSEALAAGRPLILTRPIPGQEEGNTRTLLAAGVALPGSSPRLVSDSLARLYREPGRLAEFASAARALGRPDAAARIAGAMRAEYRLATAA
jgi:processive 1,2-diacylglycerol beta-glucosyltransferase